MVDLQVSEGLMHPDASVNALGGDRAGDNAADLRWWARSRVAVDHAGSIVSLQAVGRNTGVTGCRRRLMAAKMRSKICIGWPHVRHGNLCRSPQLKHLGALARAWGSMLRLGQS